jgi:iron donor protein CyaY
MSFHKICDEALEQLAHKIETLDKNSELDVEYSDGILSIKIEKTGKTYIINRHSATQKIWYSSPFTGANYFSFDEKQKKWLDSKGEELQKKLISELENF